MDETTGYFHPGHSSIIARTGELVALLPSCMVAEQMHPKLIDGIVQDRAR